MFSRLIFSAYTPKKAPPSMKNEKFSSKGSPGEAGGSGAGCWANAIPTARIIAATTPIEYFAFMQISSGRVYGLHASKIGRFQKICVVRGLNKWLIHFGLIP